MSAAAPIRLLKITEVTAVLGVGKTTVYELLKSEPGFPKPIKIGRSTRWLDADLKKYLELKTDPEIDRLI